MAKHATLCLLVLVCGQTMAQDTLSEMPRFDRYRRLLREYGAAVPVGSLAAEWAADGESFSYSKDGKNFVYDLRTGKPVEKDADANKKKPLPRKAPERGRQFEEVISPDGKLKATCRDRNVVVSELDGRKPVTVTTDGSVANRIKNGTASWVYGEELGVKEAMWWSPDSEKLAYYRFDESAVKDYFLAMDQGSVQDRLDTEAYPKAGAPNPRVELHIFDLKTKRNVLVDAVSGDASLAEYIYGVKWTPDGRRLLFKRANRHQNRMQLMAADPGSGHVSVAGEERQPQSWVDLHPEMTLLGDGERYIWSSERDGFKNLYLRDLRDADEHVLTHNKFDAISVVRVDEAGGHVYYMANGAEMPYLRQLRRVGLDGKNDVCLTDPKFDHSVNMAPAGGHFLDTFSNVDHPEETRLMDSSGKMLDVLAQGDLTKFKALGLRNTEIFTFPSADRSVTCYGTIQFPSDFDPSRKYPVLLNVYGGPDSGGINPGFQVPNPVTEFGFLVVNLAGRGTQGRGKAFRDAVYDKLGIVEIDDQNAGIQSLVSRPYVDLSRVGVYGTSYGGYSTTMLLLRHPETFQVGCASSSVTDWRNYDSIYTERYMGLPTVEDNLQGYENGSAMKYVANLRGKLMLFFGSSDNNVHPSNTYQLVQALERAGKRYDLQVGTDQGHAQMDVTRMWEYFLTHLVVHPSAKDPLRLAYNARKRRKASARRASLIAGTP